MSMSGDQYVYIKFARNYREAIWIARWNDLVPMAQPNSKLFDVQYLVLRK